MRHVTPHFCGLLQAEVVWERLKQMAGSTPAERLMANVKCAMIRGETWAPPKLAMPSRFDKPAVCVLRRLRDMDISMCRDVNLCRVGVDRHTSRPRHLKSAGGVGLSAGRCQRDEVGQL